MNLFAILRETNPRIQIVPIAQALQQPITSLFRAQAKALLANRDPIEFEGSHNPESDEISYIESFDDPDDTLELPAKALEYAEFDPTPENLDRLLGLIVVTSIDGEQTACFQTFDKRQALTNSRWAIIKLGDGFQRLEQPGLVLDSHVSAVLQGDRLLFKSLHTASRFFDLTGYFHEATDREVEGFAANQSLVVHDKESFTSAADSQRIRKQIALVLDSKVLELPVANILAVARREAPHVKIETEGRGSKRKIVIPPNRAELKELLDLLLENYWGGYFTGKQYVANSKRTVNGGQSQPRRPAP